MKHTKCNFTCGKNIILLKALQVYIYIYIYIYIYACKAYHHFKYSVASVCKEYISTVSCTCKYASDHKHIACMTLKPAIERVYTGKSPCMLVLDNIIDDTSSLLVFL